MKLDSMMRELRALVLLLYVLDVAHSSKSAESFLPARQTAHLGATLTVAGSELSTADLVMLALSPATGGVGCGNSSHPPKPAGGIRQQNFMEVASDGRSASVNVIPTVEVAEAVWCVSLHPSRLWSPVGTATTAVDGPQVTSATTSFQGSANAFELLSFKLFGRGLVRGVTRLAFKASAVACGGSSPTSDLTGGDAVGLSSANVAGTVGTISFTLDLTSSLVGTLRLCMSSNGGVYVTVPSLSGFTIATRLTSSYSPRNIQMKPSLPYTFTVSGQNFPASGSSTLRVKASSSECGGDSKTSDVLRGDEQAATFVSQSLSTVTFSLGPIIDAVSELSISVAGTGYVAGALAAIGGGGNSFSGRFGVGLAGQLDVVYISASGKNFSTAPTIIPVYDGTVGCGGSTSGACPMTGSVTQVVKKGGQTRGCGVGSIIIAAPGSGGSGFAAEITDSDDLGQIRAIKIRDHGSGYTRAPQLISSVPGSCACGSYIVDGSATQDSFQSVGIVGAFDACFVTITGLNAEVASNGGWNTRDIRLCSRFGSTSIWRQISDSTVKLLLPEDGTFTPGTVDSGQLFTLQLTGTGFELDGPLQTRIKIAYDCNLYSGTDNQGALPGGGGRPCNSISVTGLTQTCHVQFKIVIPGTVVQAQICRRMGGSLYEKKSSSLLNINGFQLLSITPTNAVSNARYMVTVRGINFDPSLLDPTYTGILRAKICADYVCKGENTNLGEPCAGTSDQRMCRGDGMCEAETTCTADITGDTGVFFPGGSTANILTVQNCNSQNYGCTEAIFEWTLMSMANVNARVYWMYDFDRFSVFANLSQNSRFLIEGSWLTSFTQSPPSPVFSGSTMTLNITGRNLVNTGVGAVKFKWINTTDCDASRLKDDLDSFTGGDGRVLGMIGGNHSHSHGYVRFVLSYPHLLAPLKPVTLCWKIGNYRYREIEVYDQATLSPNVLGVSGFSLLQYRSRTNVYGTWVEGMSPTDFNFTRGTRISVGEQALPYFESGSKYRITVYGARFGDSAADSPLVIRPIAMPFSLGAGAILCVETDTSPATRPKTCKEFKYSIEQYDGGASGYCSGGSEIDSAHIEDYYPISIHKYQETRDGITTQKSYAVFEFSKIFLDHRSRFLVCWRMSRKDHDGFPWASIGHIDNRQRNLGIQGIISWDVWVTHTFAMTGAYIQSIRAEPEIVANRPFKLTMVGLGIGCDPANPKYRVKLAVGNGLQALVGGTIGGGCTLGSRSESEGAVTGGEAVIPTCRTDLSSGRRSVVEMTFTVLVAASTRLDLCWSSTAGTLNFKPAFYVDGLQVVTIGSNPNYITSILLDNQPIETAEKLLAHRPFSLTFLGQGLQQTGPTKLNVSIAEDCQDESTIVPGGDWRTADCLFGHESATVEFNLYRPVQKAQICTTRAISEIKFTRFIYLDNRRYYCVPTYCGAPSCVPGSNYLFDDFGCDEDCCQERCRVDPYCNFWQRYDIPGRVFRRCQTMAHCENPQILTLYDRIPIMWQKTNGLGEQIYSAATLADVKRPEVFDVTPQVNPPLRARLPFVVNVQGTGFVSSHVQIHVKIANTAIGCNDEVALKKTLAMWNEIASAREAVFAQLEAAKNFSYNGTCGGGSSNCVGGPAPPGTVCRANVDCIPGAGGSCQPANTGMSCLLNSQCTFGGICNNSLYNLSMTPPPQPPPMQIPYVEVSDAGTLIGGQGRFLTVQNFSFGYAKFQIDEAAKGVLCYSIRNPEEDKKFISDDGYITNIKLIHAMSTYTATRALEIFGPVVSTVTPDHTFLFVDTLYTVMGVGLSINDKMKLVHPSVGCSKGVLSADEADLFGAVKGGAGVKLESVNALGTLGTVRMRLSEPLKQDIDDNQLTICYLIAYPERYNEYRNVGSLFVANSPPIVTSFSPPVIYFTEPTAIVLQGMALGAAQKIKLIDADKYTCSGEVMNEQLRDEYGLAPGSFSSFLTLKDPGEYYAIFQDPYTNHAYLMQSQGLVSIPSDFQDDKNFTLCLKYADFTFAGATPGFQTVGNITARPPRMERLGSTNIYSGRRDSFLIVGTGLLSSMRILCKLVQKYHSCTGSGKVEGIVAGGSGCKVLPYPNRSSTNAFAVVSIPAGIETEARVCVRFDERSWSSIGVLAVKRPPVTNAKPVSLTSLTDPISTFVKGEPFGVKVATSIPLSNQDMVKIVLAGAACGGNDALAEAVQGGAGTNFNDQGIAIFKRGIDSGGLEVKFCIWTFGRPGYAEDGTARWTVIPPYIERFSPDKTAVGLNTQFAVTGRGLATASVKTFVYIHAGTGCSTSGERYQLVSADGMKGNHALLSAQIWLSGQYVVCLESDTSLTQISTLSVTDLPTISSVMPRVVYRKNETAFLLVGAGFKSTAQVKIVASGHSCAGNTSIAGANWSGINSAGVSIDGTRATTVGFVITDKIGSGHLCFAVDKDLSHVMSSGIEITIREWVTPILIKPRTENKTDIQRVEANMTDFVPSCSANWKSKWMLRGPGDGVERDTPAIVDWNTDFKCYKRQEDLPKGLPSDYAPPGIDSRLLSTVRGMPIEFTIAGGVGAGDQIFISKGQCGGTLTSPLEDPTTDHIPGGGAVVVTPSMIIDATGDYCGGVRRQAPFISQSVATTPSLTGSDRRSYGVQVSFTPTEISGVGQFHKLCVVPAGTSTAFSVEKIDIKVRPPMLLAMEPAIVYSGMRMPYVLRGLGLSIGDSVKIMDGETFAACERLDDNTDLRGGGTLTLQSTSLTSARVEFVFEIPCKHARVCYKYRGSNVWGEMTNALDLRTSGYSYGYEGATHFFYGESVVMQTGDNMVFGRNQTILVLAPSPKFMIGEVFVARYPFSLTVEGDGLTEKARYIIVPIRVGCGGMPAGRVNLMKDKTVYSSVRLRTVIGGESRPPTVFSNDPLDSFEKMSQCTGSGIRDGCFAAKATARNSIDYPVGISIKDMGRARVCYLHDFGSEYVEVGQIQITPPYVSHVFPRVAVINIPMSLTVTGQSLRSTDRLKLVDGTSCRGPISSRPYSIPLTVTDLPRMSAATLRVTAAGKGTYTSGIRKICYSFDKGLTYQDTGFTMTVKSPKIRRVFPTTLAISGERRIWFFGDVISPGDRVKLIHKSRICNGLDDWESIVTGGEGRALDMMSAEGQVLPNPIGESQWPDPWLNGSTVFTLQRSHEAVVCYLHRDSAGWEDVRGPDGERIVLTVRDTSDLALGRTGPEWGNTGARVRGRSAQYRLMVAASVFWCCTMTLWTVRT